jgi:peptidoglycan/LPS O-acetylase OafA/YrhL
MTPEGQVDARRVRLPEFIAGDPIRGIGVLAVIAYHVASASLLWAGVAEQQVRRAGLPAEFDALGATIGPLIETGGYALGLFFALSGYLISRPFIFAFVRQEPLPRLSSFARNRVLRIVPAFWAVFTVLLIIYGTNGASLGEIASVYGFVEAPNRTSFALIFGQAWSLRAEIVFYVLVPISAWLLLRAAKRLRGGRGLRAGVVIGVALAVAAIVVWVNSWVLTGSGDPTFGFHDPNVALVQVWYHVPAIALYQFMPGVIFAALETFLPTRARRFGDRHPGAGWVLPTAVALIGFWLLFSVQRFDPSSVPFESAMIFFGLAGVFGGPLLLQWARGGCWRLLDNRPLRLLGQRSYSIYLVHLAIVVELAPRLERAFDNNYKQTFVALLAASVVASVLIGEVVFRAVEAPFMNLKASGWRSPERMALWRRAALWIPSRVVANGPAAASAAPAMPGSAHSATRTPAGGQTAARRPRLAEFLAGDPIRGVGVLAVITYHVAFYALFVAGALERNQGRAAFTPLGKAVGTFVETGGYSLALFFALSGYLIARPFVFAVVRAEPLPRIWSYARNRLLRIVPAFWFVFTAILLIYGTKGATTGQIVSVYGFTEGWTDNPLARVIGQAWSLRAEAFFYILVPIAAGLLVWITSRLRLSLRLRTAIAVAVPLAVAVGVIYFIVHAATRFGATWVTERTSPILVFYIFMPGVALAALETFLPSHVERFGRRHVRLAWAVPTVVVIAAFATLYCNQWYDPRTPEVSASLIFVGVAGLLAGCLLLQWGTGGCWRLLDNRVFRWIGQRSYSIYLVHLAIVVELAPRVDRAFGGNYRQAFLALNVASIVASIGLGYVVFRLVEAPFMNLKRGSWRSSQRTALFRRAAWWLPSRAIEWTGGKRAVPATEPNPESAAESSVTPVAPSGS